MQILLLLLKNAIVDISSYDARLKAIFSGLFFCDTRGIEEKNRRAC